MYNTIPKSNSMVRNNYNELDKATFASQIDKALDLVLSKRNIKNGFQVIGIWPFNPKAMDGRTKSNELYIANHNNNTSNEDNVKNFNGTMNDTKGWGEDGVVVKLINIITTIDELAKTKANVDGQEQLLRYYVEKPTSLRILRDT